MVDFSNLALILSSFALGWALKRLKVMPQNSAIVLNRFIIYVSLPAITLNLIHTLVRSQQFGRENFLPIFMPWIFFGVAAATFHALGKRLGWPEKTIGALTLTAGLGNTSFIGFPLIETFYGKPSLAIGVLVDQPGSFLVLGTLGIIIAALYSGRDVSAARIAKQVFLFPPTIAGILAVTSAGYEFNYVFLGVLEKMGSCLVPLALFSVGLQFDLDGESLRAERSFLTLGLCFKLILGPTFTFVIYYFLFASRGEVLKITVFEAAMAPMISAGIIATEYDLNPKLAAFMVGIGTALSLLSIPIVWYLLNHVS